MTSDASNADHVARPASARALTAADKQGFLLAVGELLRAPDEAAAVLGRVCEYMGRFFGVARVGFGHADEALDLIDYDVCWTDGTTAPLLGVFPASAFGAAVFERLRAGQTVAMDDVWTHALTADGFAQQTSRQVDTRAVLVAPLAAAGRLRTIVYLNQGPPRTWSADEVALLEAAADRTREVVERARAEKQRRRAEAELRDSESRLRIAQRAGQVATFELMPEDGRVIVSEEFCRLWGLPPANDYETRKIVEMVHPDDVGQLLTGRRYVDNRALAYIEYRIRKADTGEERWMARRGEVVQDEAGRTRYMGVSYDITDRKTAELALQRLNETLEDEVAQRTADRDRMWRLSAELMLVVDFEGRIVAVNPAWRTLGYEAGDLEGTDVFDLLHPDDLAASQAELGKLSEGVVTLSFENRFRTRDGGWRTLAWSAAPDDRHVHAVARDVTEEREAAAALRRTEEALRQSQKMEAVGQLTGGIAHDFNNMLAIVIGSLDLAQRRLSRGQEGVETYLENAREGAQRAATLTQRLLAFSRQQPLAPRVLNLNRLVGGMSELLRRTLGEAVDVETVLAGGLWNVDADPNQLESAILNLAVNARDAMPDGGQLTIETGNAHLDEGYARANLGVEPGQYVVVAVSDRGQGMSAEVLDRVFDPFFTTKPVGKGTGLGLSMVYGFVKQSGGHVAIYSEPGDGTTVRIYLPRRHGDEAETIAGAPPPSPAMMGAGEVVLLVEDDDRVREMSAAALAELGYVVHTAAGGEQALRRLDELERVDLLFTDVVMPGMTGRQLAEAVRARGRAPSILFTTGYTRNAVVHNGVLDAGVEFLAKPFTLDDLAAKVREVLDRRNLQPGR